MSTEGTGAPMRVFVVENNEDTARYLRLYLESLGHTVCQARCLSEALQLVPLSGCELLISDIGLEDGTGWELLEKLKETGAAEKLRFAVAVSGYGRNVDRQRSEAAGFRHHLVKPYDLEELDKILAEAAAELGKR